MLFLIANPGTFGANDLPEVGRERKINGRPGEFVQRIDPTLKHRELYCVSKVVYVSRVTKVANGTLRSIN